MMYDTLYFLFFVSSTGSPGGPGLTSFPTTHSLIPSTHSAGLETGEGDGGDG